MIWEERAAFRAWGAGREEEGEGRVERLASRCRRVTRESDEVEERCKGNARRRTLEPGGGLTQIVTRRIGL